MDENESSQFMLDNWYFQVLEQRVEELDFTMYEFEINGARSDYGGNKKNLNSIFTYKKHKELGRFDLDVISEFDYPMFKFKRCQYTQFIRPEERSEKGRPIFDKGSPDYERLGVDFFQDFIVPLFLKRRK